MKSWILLAAAAMAAASLAVADEAIAADGFDVVVLCGLGGVQGGNLRADIIHRHAAYRPVVCDTGTLVNGLRVADERGAFDGVKVPADSQLSRIGHVLTN